MAEAFTKILGENSSFFVRGDISEELKKTNPVSVNAPPHGRFVFYFLWFPFFVLITRNYGKDTVFFSNDPNLLKVLIFWKKVLRFKYSICSDWHQLFLNSDDKYIAVNSDYLVSTSESLKNLIMKVSGVPSEKILVAYGGVDLNTFTNSKSKADLRKELGLPEEGFLVGYVGFYKTLGMGKGVDTMIKALSMIADRDVKMVFIGGKDAEIEEYKEMALQLGVSDRAVFLKVVPNSSIPAYEGAMDALAIPYPNKPHFRDYGFPMKVYEYMAIGRPIIYSNLPIIGEMLSDCGLSFEADSGKDLAGKIMALIVDQSLGKNLSDKALEKVKNYSWEKRAQKIIDFVGL